MLHLKCLQALNKVNCQGTWSAGLKRTLVLDNKQSDFTVHVVSIIL